MDIPTSENPIVKCAWTWRIEGDAAVGPIETQVTLSILTLTPSGEAASRLKLEGVIAFPYTAECARCLVPVTTQTSASFVSLVDLIAGTVEASDLGTPPEEGGFERVGPQEIDLTVELSQRVYLAAPAVVTCRADCKGLCSRCGANLNVRDCDCKRRSGRGSLAGLAVLLKQKTDIPPSGGR